MAKFRAFCKSLVNLGLPVLKVAMAAMRESFAERQREVPVPRTTLGTNLPENLQKDVGDMLNSPVTQHDVDMLRVEHRNSLMAMEQRMNQKFVMVIAQQRKQIQQLVTQQQQQMQDIRKMFIVESQHLGLSSPKKHLPSDSPSPSLIQNGDAAADPVANVDAEIKKGTNPEPDADIAVTEPQVPQQLSSHHNSGLSADYLSANSDSKIKENAHPEPDADIGVAEPQVLDDSKSEEFLITTRIEGSDHAKTTANHSNKM